MKTAISEAICTLFFAACIAIIFAYCYIVGPALVGGMIP